MGPFAFAFLLTCFFFAKGTEQEELRNGLDEVLGKVERGSDLRPDGYDIAALKEITKRSDGMIPILINLLVEEKEERHKLKKEMEKIKKDIKEKVHGGHIGFTVQLHASTHDLTIGAHKVIPFSHVIHSYGDSGLNTTDGVFYCPLDGFYLLSASLVSKTGNAWFTIEKNGRYIGGFYKDIHSNWGSGSVTMVVQLVKGDQVWITPRHTSAIFRESQFSVFRFSC